MKEAIHFCIICGRKFRSTSPKVVFCSSCSGLTLHTGSFGAEAEVPEEWQVGDLILGLYEVKEIFSTGGMGLVYRVHHRLWNIDLAVKSPRPALFQTEEQKQVFLAEAETWVSLGLHPHIVTCFYVRTLGGIPRIFAEFVEGGSLKDWIRTRRLYEGGPKEALRRILDLAIQFAWGLDYAHQKGVVHQDVKPANALLTSEGLLKVTDFGLVKAKGFSPAYAAPEQVLGKPVGPWTDLWGWGMSVLEMFTGEVTWMEGTAAPAVLEAYLQDPPEGLPPMPQGVVEILRACFQEDPRARPKGMAEVAQQLRAVYEAEMGEPYPRAKPEALALQADSLNNRAVSYLDLGKEEEAVQCWQEALKLNPGHVQARLNLLYYQWTRELTSAEEFLSQLDMLAQMPEYEKDGEFWYLKFILEVEIGLPSGFRSRAAESALNALFKGCRMGILSQVDQELTEEVKKWDRPGVSGLYETGNLILERVVEKSLTPEAVTLSFGDDTLYVDFLSMDHLVTVEKSGKLKIWYGGRSQTLGQLNGDLQFLITAGKFLLAGAGGRAFLFDVETERLLGEYQVGLNEKFIFLSSDGKIGVSVHTEYKEIWHDWGSNIVPVQKMLKVWDLLQGSAY
ncbi:MAG: protein kinase, partial [Deltaproteobacteria bacterium]|nr:protein kinase [Deltaproteobacteria bacterium]